MTATNYSSASFSNRLSSSRRIKKIGCYLNFIDIYADFAVSIAMNGRLDLMQFTPDLCNDCNICVESCPAGALDEEGKTHMMKCLRISQPHGLGGDIGFWRKFVDSSLEAQKKMFLTEEYMKNYQAQLIAFQYFCFNCYTACPLGDDI
jgi:ferredoxin